MEKENFKFFGQAAKNKLVKINEFPKNKKFSTENKEKNKKTFSLAEKRKVKCPKNPFEVSKKRMKFSASTF